MRKTDHYQTRITPLQRRAVRWLAEQRKVPDAQIVREALDGYFLTCPEMSELLKARQRGSGLAPTP